MNCEFAIRLMKRSKLSSKNTKINAKSGEKSPQTLSDNKKPKHYKKTKTKKKTMKKKPDL